LEKYNHPPEEPGLFTDEADSKGATPPQINRTKKLNLLIQRMNLAADETDEADKTDKTDEGDENDEGDCG